MDEQTMPMEEKGKAEGMHEYPASQEQYTRYKGALSPFTGEILDMHAQGMSQAQIVRALAGRVKERTGMLLYPALIRYVLECYGRYKKSPSKRPRTPTTINKNTATEAWELVAEMDGTKLKRIVAKSPYRPLATDVTDDFLALLKNALLKDLFSKKDRI